MGLEAEDEGEADEEEALLLLLLLGRALLALALEAAALAWLANDESLALLAAAEALLAAALSEAAADDWAAPVAVAATEAREERVLPAAEPLKGLADEGELLFDAEADAVGWLPDAVATGVLALEAVGEALPLLPLPLALAPLP